MPEDGLPAGDGEAGKEAVGKEEEMDLQREEKDESHPEFLKSEEEELEQTDVGDEATPPQDVLDAVQTDGIERMDAESVAKHDVAAQAEKHEGLPEDDEGVGLFRMRNKRYAVDQT